MKHYNRFIFLSTFSRAMLEVFVPIILFTLGFGIKEILFSLLIITLSKLLNSILASYLGKRITFKWILIISSVFFGLSYYILSIINHSMLLLITFSILQGCFTGFYWVGRHNCALRCIPKRHMTISIALVMTFITIATHSAAFIGSIFLDNISSDLLILISVIFYLFSTIPLFNIKETSKITLTQIRPILTTMTKRNFLFFSMQQFRDIKAYFFPLFVFLYIQKSYVFIGYIDVIIGLASIIFIHYFAKYVDHNKKDFYLSICVLSGLIYILNLNTPIPIVILITAFIEGINIKAYNTVMDHNLYSLGKNYIYSDYIMLIEIIYNVSQALILIVFLALDLSIIQILYISILGIVLSGFVPFQHSINNHKEKTQV